MKQWIENITNILRHPQYPQIKSNLEVKGDDGEIIGKCALGEIRCQSHAKRPTDSWDICDGDGIIMQAVGVPEDLRKGGILPDFDSDFSVICDVCDIGSLTDVNLQNWIYSLNDAGFTYAQICEWLETTFE